MVTDEQRRRQPKRITRMTSEAVVANRFPGRPSTVSLAQHGLEYGPAFEKVTEVWRRDGEALARLVARRCRRHSMRRCWTAVFRRSPPLCPANNGHSHDTYLPIGVAQLRVRRDVTGRRLVPRTVARRVRFRAPHRRRRRVPARRVRGGAYGGTRAAPSSASCRLRAEHDPKPDADGDLFVPRWEAASLQSGSNS